MHHIRHAALFMSALAPMFLYGCAGDISKEDVHRLGHMEIIYLQPDANLTAADSSGGTGYAVLYLLAGPLAVVGGAAGVSQKNEYQKEAIAANMAAIKSLGFDDRVHSIFTSAISDASWLPNRDIKVIQGMDSPDAYTLKSPADSVVYLMPRFALTSFGHVFMVDVTVGVQQYVRNGQYSHLTNLYTREFTFKHDLVLKKPGMTWDQQVDAGHELAQLAPDDATRIWLENDGERLRTDFAEDIPQIETDVRQFFDDNPAMTSRDPVP